MFRKDRLGRRAGGVIIYIKESIQAYKIKLEKEAEYEEAVWCNIVTGNSTLTVGLVYHSSNISIEEKETVHNAIRETRLEGQGSLQENNYSFFWTGKEPGIRREAGVGFAIANKLVKQLPMLPTGISERLITPRK